MADEVTVNEIKPKEPVAEENKAPAPESNSEVPSDKPEEQK